MVTQALYTLSKADFDHYYSERARAAAAAGGAGRRAQARACCPEGRGCGVR
jgi:hypothetical protein